jgi:hypothetical protein
MSEKRNIFQKTGAIVLSVQYKRRGTNLTVTTIEGFFVM